MAVKLDLEKAYNVLDLSSIKSCLSQFGFSVAWCDRIMNCITSTSFSILINGSPHGYFTPSMKSIMQIQHKSTIGRYLGISNIVFWKDPLNAKNMVERIKGKFAGWKAQTLSRAGRLTLIKASVSGIPIILYPVLNVLQKSAK
ncbi:hypothetical protein L3X38_040391 [Prunus dulcis]|uniref:Reverse transcriptase domain-containing protein n=1 Tax=Prunus dulcis TaxID=3755 RepID=A0AAD4VA12_PRUDU|nr:hypothetical protein L3X38_040391 [Prunus dulcis]